MRQKGYIDFSAAGIALFSSATIYRMKSELILELQEPPTPPIEKQVKELIPPPIQLPFRYEYTSTTIENLIQALEESLKNTKVEEIHPRLVPITPDPLFVQEIDEFMVDIENKIDRMYQNISQFQNKVISLSQLTVGLKRLEVIRSFLLVLFLACRGKIQLWQEENFGEIYFSIIKCDPKDGKTKA